MQTIKFCVHENPPKAGFVISGSPIPAGRRRRQAVTAEFPEMSAASRGDAVKRYPNEFNRSIAMTVRAKFRCTAKNAFTLNNSDGTTTTAATVTLAAVFARAEDGSGQACEENRIFGQWTPSGQLTMGIHNPAAHEQFEVGKEYYLDISPAPDTPRRDYPYLAGDHASA